MRILTAGALAALGVASIGAAADLDHVLLPGDGLTTRLLRGERRTLAVAAVPGQKISVLVKRGKGSSVEPTLTVSAPDGTDVDPGKRLRRSKRSARLGGLKADQAGRWSIGMSALSGGGDVRVRVGGSVPRSARMTGATTSADTPAVQPFHVLPGSEVTVKVTGKGKPAWDPAVEIVTPSGDRIPLPPGKRGATKVVLDELGEHWLSVGGGPGEFGAKLKIKAPRVRGRPLEFGDVEALPTITGFSPSSVRNQDDRVEIVVTGFGFAPQHSVTLSTVEKGYASGKISMTGEGGRATLDTSDVPPGTYRIGVSTAAGNSVYADDPIEVTNRAPGILYVSAPEIGFAGDIDMKFTGRGYDPDCTVSLERTSDGAEVPVTIVGRESSTILDTILHLPPYQVGPHDAVLTDPSGLSQRYVGYFDVLGYRGPPVDVWESEGEDAWGASFAEDAAYDALRDRVLVGAIFDGQAQFLLLDAGTTEVLQTWPAPIDYAGSLHSGPRVAWSPVDDTFVMTWNATYGTSDRGWLRVCEASDPSIELSRVRLAQDNRVSPVDVAVNDDDGGAIVVWEEWDPTTGSNLLTTTVSSDGLVDLDGVNTITQSATGTTWWPSIVYRGDARFVVAYVGTNISETDLALRRIVLHTNGEVAQGSFQIAASGDWYGMWRPEMAVNPNDRSILLVFSYYDIGIEWWRPGFTLLEGVGSATDSVQARSSDGLLAYGYASSVVWNPEREEFAVGMTDQLGDVRSTVRRVDADGRMKPRWLPVEHEGFYTVLWSGPESGQMGYIRSCDGDDSDDRSRYWGTQCVVRVGRIR